MDKNKLKIQWNRFVKSGYRESRFTVDLYEALHTRSVFIAHFNRQGFHKARFWTTRDLDHTLEMMSKCKNLKDIYSSVNIDDYIQARLSVARIEYSVLITQGRVILDHAEKIKSRYRNEVF